jgi:MFS family permease
MTAIPIAIFIIAPISGRLSDLFGSKELCIAGAAIETATLFLLAGVLGHGLDEHIGTAEVLTALCAIGLGMGLFQSPNNNAIMGTVPKDKLSVASALIATIRNLGLFTGVGFGTSLFSWKGQESGNMIEALHFSFLCAGLAGVCAVIASLGKTKNEKQI